MNTGIRKQRKIETAEERAARLALESQTKRAADAADDDAVDRAIRRNIEQQGA